MSLPWRFASAEEYVKGTIERLKRSSSTSLTTLNIGKYYLSGDDLTAQHINAILRAAISNENVTDLTLCGITIVEDHDEPDESLSSSEPSLRQQLTELLMTRSWKRLTLTSCSGVVFLALSLSTVSVGTSTQQQPILVDSIRIKNCPLSEQDSLALEHNLKTNPRLSHLEICEVTLSSSSHDQPIIRPLARGIAASISLKVMEFNYCTWKNTHDDNGDDNSQAAIQCLAREGLAKNTSLTTLNLPGCELEDEAVRQLVNEGISCHPTLKHLKLFRNHCGDEGVQALVALLLQSAETDFDHDSSKAPKTQLETLDLSYQQFERAKKLNVEILANSLRTLENLFLSFNKLDDGDAECLVKALKGNKSLVEIDLRANNIRDEGAVALAEGVVSQLPRLRKFSLYGNPLGERGAKSLLAAIQKNTEIHSMNMDYSLSVYDETQYYAFLNRAGRRLLKKNDVNDALWTIVIERAGRISLDTRGVCTAADLIYPFIRDPAVFNVLRQSNETK